MYPNKTHKKALKRPAHTFVIGEEVSVYRGARLVVITKVLHVDDQGVHTQYHPRDWPSPWGWTVTGLQPLSPYVDKSNRMHLQPISPADRDELDRRGLVAECSSVNWELLPLAVLRAVMGHVKKG